MTRHILQISDIHIGGEYDGKFRCRLNFLATLMEALRLDGTGLGRIVITGDLADTAYRINYEWVKKVLDRTGMDYFVLPGNHDDIDTMRSVFGDHTIPAGQYWVIDDDVMYWDNCPGSNDGSALPANMEGVRYVFCHYPVGDVSHAFMEKHAHPDAASLCLRLAGAGVTDVFCGHFHFRSDVVNDGVMVHVCAATQAQLDPCASECRPMPEASPEYCVVHIDDDGATRDCWTVRAGDFERRLDEVLYRCRSVCDFVRDEAGICLNALYIDGAPVDGLVPDAYFAIKTILRHAKAMSELYDDIKGGE